jgi:hypothetical protein
LLAEFAPRYPPPVQPAGSLSAALIMVFAIAWNHGPRNQCLRIPSRIFFPYGIREAVFLDVICPLLSSPFSVLVAWEEETKSCP